MDKILEPIPSQKSVAPLCPVFGICGGCAYQNLPYEEELLLKESALKRLIQERFEIPDTVFEAIVPSPEPYHYRNRLDLTLRRLRGGGFKLGFQLPDSHRIVEVESCAIARKEISDFLPELKKQGCEKMPENYENANLVVRTGDDGRIFWGGIGRRSLVMREPDYFWTEIRGKKIFYSLETFFQANLSILGALLDKIERFGRFDSRTIFFDLYSGVGLFGLAFAEKAGKVVMIEEAPDSAKLARFNVARHKLTHANVLCEKVETGLHVSLAACPAGRRVALVDPPRRGLSEQVLGILAAAKSFEAFFYLSCHPESLVRDLAAFLKQGWRIEKIAPFDFFPKTAHLETLVLLKPERTHA